MIQECHKIVQFRNKILAGTHPRIQLPPQLAAKVAAAQKVPPPNLQSTADAAKRWPRSHQTNTDSVKTKSPVVIPRPSQAVAATAAAPASKPFATGNAEINPIFLEKSEQLIKAELKLERDKLERALKEEVDQQKRYKFNAAQVESPRDELDVSDIFAKAQALVQAAAAPSVSATANVTNAAADGDSSFDENDYYSSRHETLESRDSGAEQSEPVEAAGADLKMTDKRAAPPAAPGQVGVFQQQPPTGPRADGYHPPQPARLPLPHPPSVPQLPQNPPTSNTEPQSDIGGTNGGTPDGRSRQTKALRRSQRLRNMQDSLESGEATQSDTSARLDMYQNPAQQSASEVEPMEHHRRAPPLIRSHNLTPVAPQAAHVSSLVAASSAMVPGAGGTPNGNGHRGAPPQIAALRGELRGISSPESSSPRATVGEKRKGKKKNKRKADKLGQDTSSTPYIKPEPRSPSPLSAPANIRPAKRRKQQGQQYALLPEDLPEQAPARPDYYQLVDSNQAEPIPVAYGRRDDLYQPGSGRPSPRLVSQGYERVYRDDAPVAQPAAPPHYIRQGNSPRARYAVQYADEPHYPVRSASQALPSRGYYQDEYGRVDVDAPLGGSQRQPLRRVLVDSFGREYFEPLPAPVARQSLAPTVRYGDPEVIYEGTAPVRHSVAPQMRPREPDVIYERTVPARAMSRRPGPEVYEEGGVIYRRASPVPFPAPRRVTTQPEFGPDGMAYQSRGYSVRPAPVDDYAPDQGFVERRPVEGGAPRQYIARSASVRPLEHVRYEYPTDMRGRLHGPRADGVPGEYSAPLSRPESRVEMMAPPAARDYGPPQVVQRPYSVRPVERYYGQPAPVDDGEVAYIERPGARPDVVYSSEPRREVYR